MLAHISELCLNTVVFQGIISVPQFWLFFSFMIHKLDSIPGNKDSIVSGLRIGIGLLKSSPSVFRVHSEWKTTGGCTTIYLFFNPCWWPSGLLPLSLLLQAVLRRSMSGACSLPVCTEWNCFKEQAVCLVCWVCPTGPQSLLTQKCSDFLKPHSTEEYQAFKFQPAWWL